MFTYSLAVVLRGYDIKTRLCTLEFVYMCTKSMFKYALRSVKRRLKVVHDCIRLLKKLAKVDKCLAVWSGEERAALLQNITRNRPCLQLCTYCERLGRPVSWSRKSRSPRTFKCFSASLTAARVPRLRRKTISASTFAGCYWRSFLSRRTILVCANLTIRNTFKSIKYYPTIVV